MKIYLPEVSKQVYVSCKDWLLVTPEGDIDVFLLHPLTRVRIDLPKFNTLELYHPCGSHFVDKAVLSANPSTTLDFIVMIICGNHGQLAFCKDGDTSWSWTSIDFWGPGKFLDINYCDNKLYGLDREHRIISCDINGSNPTKLVEVFVNLPYKWGDEKSYLVPHPSLGGKFFIIHRYQEFPEGDINNYEYYTNGFKVYEVDIEDGTWEEVENLGNRALFLGYNTSFIIECNAFNNCKPNCIYFSEDRAELFLCPVSLIYDGDGDGDDDDVIGGGKDMGIYDISDGTILPFFDDIVTSKITPLTWIAPSIF